MFVTPTALPVTVRVPTLTFVAPSGTLVPVRSIILMVKVVFGPGNVDGVENVTHAGEVKPVMSATAGVERVTVYLASDEPIRSRVEDDRDGRCPTDCGI